MGRRRAPGCVQKNPRHRSPCRSNNGLGTMKTFISRILLPLLFLSVCLGASPAQKSVELAAFLPAETLFYAVVPRVSDAVEGLRAHPFSKAMEDEEFKAFLEPLLAIVDKALKEADTRLEETSGYTLADIKSLLRGRVEMAVVRVEEVDGKPIPEMAILIEVGDEEKEARSLWDHLMNQADAAGERVTREKVGDVEVDRFEDPVSMSAFFTRGCFFFTTGGNLGPAILKNAPEKDGRLIDDPAFGTSLGRVKADSSHGFFFVHTRDLLRLGLQRMSVEEDPETTVKESVMRSAGILSLGWFAMSLRFGPAGIREVLHVHTGAERKGFFRILDCFKPGLTQAKLLRPDTLVFAGARLDVTRAFDILMETTLDILRETEPDDHERTRTALAKADADDQEFKLHADFLASLGEEVSLSLSLPRAGGVIPEGLAVIEVKKPETLIRMLDRAAEGKLDWKVKVCRVAGSEVPLFTLEIKGVPGQPAVAVLDRILVTGMPLSNVKKFLHGRKDSLSGAGVFQTALASLGLQDTSRMSNVLFVDLKTVVSCALENLAPMLSSLDPDTLPGGIDLALLPGSEAIARLFTPLVSTMKVHEDSFSFVTQSPVGLNMSLVLSAIGLGTFRAAREQERVAAERVRAKLLPPRGTLGIEVEDVAEGAGCKVNIVDAGSAAKAAGLEPGDVILAVDGKAARDVDVLAKHLEGMAAGKILSLKIRRGDKVLTLSATLKAR